MVLRTHTGTRLVLPQEATRGWDGNDEEEEDEEDWLWGEDEDEDEECEEDSGAPDGGWGWVVALASFVIYALASMFGNCFGVLFSGFFLKLHTSSTKVSEIFNLAFALSSFFSFLTGPLVEQFGWRRVTFATSVVYSLGLASSAVATSASYFFVFTIMLAGLCILLLEVIAQHTVSLYFTSKRRLATCIVTLGTCASQVLLTPLITCLQEEYSHRGATLVMAALALNCCVAAMFLLPVEWHKRERRAGYPEGYVEKSTLSPSLSPLSSPLKPMISTGEGLLRLPEESLRNLPSKRGHQVGCSEYYVEEGTLSPSLSPLSSPIQSTVDGHLRERQVGCAEDYMEKGSLSPSLSPLPQKPVYTSEGVLRPAQASLRNLRDVRESQDEEVERSTLSPYLSPSPHKSVSTSGGFLKVAQASLRNLRYLKSPRIALVSMILACNISSLVNIWAIVPFALKTDGYSSQDVALCLSVAGLCNMASRLINGVLSCWATFTVQKLYIIGSAMSALGIIGFCWVDSLAWKIALFGVCGLGNGTVSTLYSLVAVEAEGLHMQLPVLSLAGLITGLWFLLVDPLTGLVRDVSGSYSMCLGVLGCFLLASLVLWLLMPASAHHLPQRHHRSEVRPLVQPSRPSKQKFMATDEQTLQGNPREI